MRPCWRSTTERCSEKNAARPGFENHSGKPRRHVAASLLISGRPALEEAAIGPTLSHAADMGNLSKRRTHFNQCVPTFESVSEERCSTPRPTHASGMRSSLVERRRESGARSVRWLRVRDRPSSFLGTKHWKKPETESIITRTYERMEGLRQGNPPDSPRSLALMWLEPGSDVAVPEKPLPNPPRRTYRSYARGDRFGSMPGTAAAPWLLFTNAANVSPKQTSA